jgi:DNA-binding NarL/FixJ family response regulator
VDDDAAFRALLRHLLARAGIEVVDAARGEDALALAESGILDAVILDVALTDIDGFEVCRELRDRYGEMLPIVFVSGERFESHDRVAGLLVGADDYLMKPVDPAELLARLRRLLVRSRPSNGSSRGGQPNGLTAREVEVLRLLAHGSDSRTIAEQLFISEKTVASHLQRVMAKLGVNSRAQAVARAYEDGLLNGTARTA